MYNEMNFNDILVKGAFEFGAAVDEKMMDNFIQYRELLKEWNQKINLTAIEEDIDIAEKHFVDSLTVLPFLPQGRCNLVDIGTGAGFPGIPLKIVKPDIEVMLVDSLDKRINFLREVVSHLKLEGIHAAHARAEEFGAKPEYREKYDISIARAVASLPVLLEYCLPATRVGGMFIAMKGSSMEVEAAQSKKALEILGGKIEEIRELILPFSDMKRNIIIIRKFRQTPTKYPRKPGKPSKEPLIQA